jgi:hypothetical protein
LGTWVDQDRSMQMQMDRLTKSYRLAKTRRFWIIKYIIWISMEEIEIDF